MNILVVDLAQTNRYDNLWIDVLAVISNSSDKLKNNYINLDPKQFCCFTAVIIDNRIVCFSALQMEERWGDKIGRCSTRMWIHPEFRHKGMTKFSGGSKFLNTTYCVPLQIMKAKLLNLDCVFISREENLRGFKEYLKLVEINSNATFTLLPNLVNVCGIKPVPESCQQYVAVHYLTDSGEIEWNKNMEKYYL
jgi:hypothetical protein